MSIRQPSFYHVKQEAIPAGALVGFLITLLMLCSDGLPIRTLCSHPIAGSGTSLQARFAVEEFLSPMFPQIEWRYKFLGGPLRTPRTFVMSWTTNGTDCDVLLGPGGSSLALAQSPLVNALWLDFAATSTELSNKVLHPTFSRVVPTDSIGGQTLVGAIARYGWTRVNILCVDSAYGNSFASGVQTALSEHGGRVDVMRCVLTTPTNATLNSALDQLLLSPSNVVVVSMNKVDTAFVMLFALLKDRRLMNSFIFLFAESFCSSPTPLYLSFDGALCAMYAVNATRKAPFIAAYNSRNTTGEAARLATAGFDVSTLNLFADDSYASLAHDAALLAMTALNATLGVHPTSDYMKLIDVARQTVVQGLTGSILLDSFGNRPYADAVLVNVYNLSQSAVGTIANMTLTDTSLATTRGIHLMGSFFGANSVPSGLTVFPSTALASYMVLVGVVVAATIFVLLIVVFNHYRKHPFVKRLIKSGLFAMLFQVIVLIALVIIRILAAITVNSLVSSVGFMVVFLMVTASSVVVHAIEIFQVGGYFALTLNDSTTEDNNEREMEQALEKKEKQIELVHLLGLAIDDVPLLILSIAALILMGEANVIVLVSLCASGLFIGTKINEVKQHVTQVLLMPPAPGRRFTTLRSLARFIRLAIRFSGGSAQFRFASHHLGHASSPAELKAFQTHLEANDHARFQFVRNTAKDLHAQMLLGTAASADEYYAVLAVLLDQRFDPETPCSTEQAFAVTPGMPVLVPSDVRPFASVNGTVSNPLSFGGLGKRNVSVVEDPNDMSITSITSNNV